MRIAIITVLSACSGTARTHPARTGSPLPCEIRDYTIRSVGAYVERTNKAGGERVRGAELFIEAEPGLTAEWLRLQLERHIEAARNAAPSTDCPLDVDGSHVAVVSTGPGFVVRVSADDEDGADEILRRARLQASAHSR